jgi:hypothetical protein
MLADRPISDPVGALAGGVLYPSQSKRAILDFIYGELPVWRDRADRPVVQAETKLTAQLCAHLNSAARRRRGWDTYQFRVEEPDEVKGSRNYDLIASPAGETIVIEGRAYADFDVIMPLECKRLPTPLGGERDEREYVITNKGTTGGIQRFKQGLHASTHSQAAMIAYVQEKTLDHWFAEVQKWIRELSERGEHDWSAADSLRNEAVDVSARTAIHVSDHSRTKLSPLRITHLWIAM